MKKTWIRWIMIGVFLFSAASVCAAQPQDLSLVYKFMNPDGSVFRVTNYYLRDNTKFRVEYLSDDGTPHTVQIVRKDKNLVWTLDPPTKGYVETAIAKDTWEHALYAIFATDAHKAKKTGTTTFLKQPCDVYEAGADGWITTSTIAQSSNIVLKSVLTQDGKLVQTMEASQLRLEKPAAALFEIPAGYTKGR